MGINGKVYLGGDKIGHELKAELKVFLEERGLDFVDLGVFQDDQTEYQDIVREVSEKVSEEDGAYGILVFGKV